MKRILAFITSPPLIFAGIAFLAYGILAPQLGFYWDDLPISWLRYELGQEALTKYFSTNRPAWGIWYNFLTNFIPHNPLPWQILALLWRWLSSLAFFAILRELLPKEKKLALSASLLFLLYPGFNQQPVSFVYGYHFTVYTLFLFSLYAMLRTLRRPSLLITILGVLASALNLVMGEYFFALDLIRPLLLWFVLREITAPQARIRRVFSAWFPYLIIFVAGILGRSLIFNNQIYSYSLLDNLKAAPLPALWELIQTVFLSLWTTLISAWGQAFILPDFALQGKVTIGIYLFILITIFSFLLFTIKKTDTSSRGSTSAKAISPTVGEAATLQKNAPRSDAIALITIGIFAMLLAGVPFWLTDLPISLGFPANRATLPFIFGSTLVLVGVLSLTPRKTLSSILLMLLIAFSAGRQFLWADEFRRDWTVQRNLFWQMSWRIPALEENTAILLNEGALKFYADNSLSAPLNWIYAPETTTERIPYMLYYPRSRFGVEGEGLQPNMPLTHDFIASEWKGNSDQMLLINFDPPGCLHVLDPELDPDNKFIADLLLRDAAPFSRPELILTDGEPVLPEIYGPEPKHGWCYYFQKADLARQRGDWEKVVVLGEKAFNSGDHPNDPTEYLLFIEAYAHTNDWENAEQLSIRAKRVSPSYMKPLLCPLWERIIGEISNSSQKDGVLSHVMDDLGCK
ncbi:MAG: hypothetical protein GY755_00370 [Chloroflexi bacterium]|nr:hypothetical protein [Chloroflexota bacterium]